MPGNRVINVKRKCPTISIRNVNDYTTEDDFINRIKQQNPQIKEKLENGESEFSVVFTKEHKRKTESGEHDEHYPKEFQVVARVSGDIHAIINANNNKVFLGFSSHHVVDRFYVKSCSSCHRFGHYHADCQSDPICGYCCSSEHESLQCPVYKKKDCSKYKCINCEEAGIESNGHSCHWSKCPTYVERQKKLETIVQLRQLSQLRQLRNVQSCAGMYGQYRMRRSWKILYKYSMIKT